MYSSSDLPLFTLCIFLYVVLVYIPRATRVVSAKVCATTLELLAVHVVDQYFGDFIYLSARAINCVIVIKINIL